MHIAISAVMRVFLDEFPRLIMHVWFYLECYYCCATIKRWTHRLRLLLLLPGGSSSSDEIFLFKSLELGCLFSFTKVETGAWISIFSPFVLI